MNGPSLNVNWVPGITLEEMEKQCILSAFRFYRSNKTHTAQSLGIAIRTLENKLEKYEADSEREQKRFEDDRERQRAINQRMRGGELTRRFQVGSGDRINPEFDGERIKENLGTSKENSEAGDGAGSGERMEPSDEIRAEQNLPVPKRKEVQGVLPRQAASNSKYRNR